jgi:pilus assembly protein FimV
MLIYKPPIFRAGMGTKMMGIFRSGAAIALLMGAALAAQAAGLGKLTVNSALGQILNAEIDLVSLQPGEVDSLTARVASPEAFRDARIEYSTSLRLLRFSVEKRPNGQPYLKVTSVAPINEPFVDVLIEVTWPAGRIQREYPILLDPPGYAQGRVTAPSVAAAPTPRPADTPPAASPAASPSTPGDSAVAGTGSPSASAEMPRGAEPAASTTTTAGSDTYGPVQKGETLRKIAEQVKPSSVSMEQMLVSLYRENKSAFSGNNMNRLKTGQILKVPSADEVTQVEQREANREIRTQVADWKGYRDSLASGVASLPARTESSNVASGRVSSAAVTPPAPLGAPDRDVLKLSKSEQSGKAGATKGGAASQDRLNALQEEVTAKDKALRDSQSRVSDLEKQIRDMQRLLDLKAATPAKPADSKVAAAPVPVPVAPAKVEPPKPEPVKAAEPPKVAEVKPAEAPKAAEAKPAEAPKPAVPPPSEPPKVADASKPAAKPAKKAGPPPKTWTDDLADNWHYLAIGGLVIVGLVGGFLFVRRRKERAEAGPTSSMTSAFPSDLKPNTSTGKAGGGLVDTGNSSFLTDFDKTGPGTIDTDEVDPVAEAEVYIAYGRDAQAEEILKEAMARDKGRHEIALKLLEIYHARKSSTAFETVAKELRAAVGDTHPMWQKAAAMGAQIDPANPLYAAAAGGTATFTAMSPSAAPAKPELDFDLEGGSNKSETESSAPSPDFDLDLDSRKAGQHAQVPDLPTESSPSIDFDLAPSQHSASHSLDMPAESPKDEKPAFDFDLSGLEFPGTKGADKPAASPGASSTGNLDLADLSLDSPAESGGGEAVGTKLELAKAYLEIGDKDGARDILQEVAKEGSSAQKEEAKKLIASL